MLSPTKLQAERSGLSQRFVAANADSVDPEKKKGPCPYEKTEEFASIGIVYTKPGYGVTAADLKYPKMLLAEAVDRVLADREKDRLCREHGASPETRLVLIPEGMGTRNAQALIDITDVAVEETLERRAAEQAKKNNVQVLSP